MDRSCRVPECPRPFYARELCNAHYILARKYPSDTDIELAARARRPRTAEEVVADLMARSVMVGECREWQGSRDRHGYGNLRWNKRLWGTHRLLYHLTVEPVTAGIEVCHSCDNPPCILAAHLFTGSHHDNMLDAAAKGLMAGNGGRSGVRNGRASLTADQVRSIRAATGRQVDIAARFGVSQGVVGKVRRGRSYTDVGASS